MTLIPIDSLCHLLIRTAVAALLLSAGAHKLMTLREFRTKLRAYDVLGGSFNDLLAPLLPVIELTIGLAVLLPNAILQSLALAAAAGLLGLYGAVIGFNLRRGNSKIDCGCLGFGVRRAELVWPMAWRNAVMSMIAMLTALTCSDQRILTWLDWLCVPLGLAVLGLLYLALDQLISLPTREPLP